MREPRRVPHELIGMEQLQQRTTFARLVKPRLEDDESLPGLLLRCDDINGWPCGVTFDFTSFASFL